MSKLVNYDYERLKTFVGLFYDWFMATAGHQLDNHPLAVIGRVEVKSFAQARKGLEMAVNDCVEMSSDWPPEVVELADKRFLDNSSYSLSQVRAKYSRKFLSIEKKGSIKSLNEYYLVKGVLDGGMYDPEGMGAEKLEAMLDEFERRGVNDSGR